MKGGAMGSAGTEGDAGTQEGRWGGVWVGDVCWELHVMAGEGSPGRALE